MEAPPPIEECDDPDTLEGMRPEDLPFSARIPPGDPEAAAVGKIPFVLDERFVEANKARNAKRCVLDCKGRGALFGYACSDSSIIGQGSHDAGCEVHSLN